MKVYIYGPNANPGAAIIAEGECDGLGNTEAPMMVKIDTLHGALASGTQYTLTFGARLQNVNPGQNGAPSAAECKRVIGDERAFFKPA